MAGYDDRHAIYRTGTSDGAVCIWLADLARNFAVASRLAAWNLPQRLPHSKLKYRATQIQRSTKTSASREVGAVTHTRERIIHQL